MKVDEKALELFSVQNNLLLDNLKGKRLNEGGAVHQSDPYDILVASPPGDDLNILNNITHAEISKLFRFSNSLIQITNALRFCRTNNIQNLIIPEAWFVDSGIHKISDNLSVITKDAFQPNANSANLILRGRFFYTGSLAHLLGERNRGANLGLFAPSMNLDFHSPSMQSDELVIHIRSGDVFEGNGAHINYGQPPLDYYKLVLDRERPNKVYLVFENENNPVIRPLIEHIDKTIPRREVVSGSLPNDINFLLKSRTLVAGRGTFLQGVVCLSHNIKKVYTFEGQFSLWGKQGVEVINIEDTAGEFKEIVLRKWQNTEVQRQLMLTYSLERLD